MIRYTVNRTNINWHSKSNRRLKSRIKCGSCISNTWLPSNCSSMATTREARKSIGSSECRSSSLVISNSLMGGCSETSLRNAWKVSPHICFRIWIHICSLVPILCPIKLSHRYSTCILWCQIPLLIVWTELKLTTIQGAFSVYTAKTLFWVQRVTLQTTIY